jgi:hypothetical protein
MAKSNVKADLIMRNDQAGWIGGSMGQWVEAPQPLRSDVSTSRPRGQHQP